ncbi:hypothetical protein HNR46_002895 [Haloferula luteola]|uniref:Sulfotransferase family protein n=1 Tax=Haloferula luteola TaxID=595692 RepID=A0A840V2X5_9BACT|nr:sulfotransferase [Haloferula luteola]MBB5352647.1 hypothetical protein [Haloferula luteola]
MTRPLFLLSLPRAGSTLLQRMLMASGEVATLGEPSLLLRFLGNDEIMTRRAPYWDYLVSQAMDDMRQASPGFDARYREGVRQLALGVYDELAAGKPWFLDKTPRYSLIADEIGRTFPDARFIILWRHPLAVASSMCDTFCRGAWEVDDYAIDLHRGLDSLLGFAATHPDRIAEVRYEDLVSNPVAEMEKLECYLGLSGLAAHARQPALTAGGSLGDPTGVVKYQGVSEQSREAWRSAYDNWGRRRWARRYFSNPERRASLAKLGYHLPPEMASTPWWQGSLVQGWRDWKSTIGTPKRLRQGPRWQSRFVEKFHAKNGFPIGFQ